MSEPMAPMRDEADAAVDWRAWVAVDAELGEIFWLELEGDGFEFEFEFETELELETWGSSEDTCLPIATSIIPRYKIALSTVLKFTIFLILLLFSTSFFLLSFVSSVSGIPTLKLKANLAFYNFSAQL